MRWHWLEPTLADMAVKCAPEPQGEEMHPRCAALRQSRYGGKISLPESETREWNRDYSPLMPFRA